MSSFSRHLALSILISSGFSFAIYVEYFGLTHIAFVETIVALAVYTALLLAPTRVLFLSGFFIGVFWFYWVGFSFRYYDLPYLQGVVVLVFATAYMLYFGLLAVATKPYFRALVLFLLSYIDIFGFNWMVVELPLLFSYFGSSKWQFALILGTLALVLTLKTPYRFLLLLLLLFALDRGVQSEPLDMKIKLVQTYIKQDEKWDLSMQSEIVEENFAQIDSAIESGYDVVVLPESTFPLFLNHREDLLERLLRRSKKIAIVTGALLYEMGDNYNVTYFFHNSTMHIAKKMVLVPFGEYIPLPSPVDRWINKLFFDGASDYKRADRPTDFTIDGVVFRNAICYEATSKELFEDSPRYMIAISNNGWFTPSVEPVLQKMLMLHYAKIYNTTIYHSANMAGSGVVNYSIGD